jgi:hypothetical protein
MNPLTNIQKRFILFLMFCIPSRLLLAHFAKTTNSPLIAYLTTVIGFGFLYLYFSGSRKRGAEVFGEKIWWNDLRPLHGSLYLLFSYLVLFHKNPNAYLVILLDTIIGLIAFFGFHLGLFFI